MPLIGIVRGVGEGYVATDYIIKLLKALNRRFRIKIEYSQIPAGDYTEHGHLLTDDALSLMRKCDCVYVGDMYSRSNPVDYTYKDIAMALSNNIGYACISGFGKFANINVEIASYFDGGFSLREGIRSPEGCSEMRMCSSFTMKNIAKNVSMACENRRRILAFVKDGDNEYCADIFKQMFISYTLPSTNFKFFNYTTRDIVREIMTSPGQFDTIFASETFLEIVLGIYEYIMGNDFVFYNKFTSEKSVYVLRSLLSNSQSDNFLPSLPSYIVALCDLLRNEFNMEKESAHLIFAMERALNEGYSCDDSDSFICAVIENLKSPVNTKFSKKKPLSRHIYK